MKEQNNGLDEFYGKDGLPKKCTWCLKEYPEITFPASDQIPPVCVDCRRDTIHI